MEGSHRGLNYGTIQAFVRRDLEKPRKNSVRIADLRAGI
jgi:hypothetical protein